MANEESVENTEDLDTAEQTVETHEGFVALEARDKDVNAQHKKFREEERGRIEEKGRADGLQKQIDDIKATDAQVDIPPAPDPYSETYTADIATRDEAIRNQAAQDADLTRKTEQRKIEDEARITKENQILNDKVAAFDKNMVTHGLNPNEIKTATDTVIGYGISNPFQDVLLEDPDGPLLVQYLANNPVELGNMDQMSTLQLVNHINSDVRAKAQLLKPQTSNAPAPPVTLRGGGAPEQAESWEKGAVYN